MNYTEGVTIILGLCLLFYILFGGADFGAGILEIFTGGKVQETISRAIAPVWEANHIWLIIVVVILFTGFPAVYALLTTNLHLPILLFLIGIIARGASFAFRKSDAFEDASHRYYTGIFRYASVLTPFFIGITVAALSLGTIPYGSDDFIAAYVTSWLNLPSLVFGLFVTLIAAYAAAVFLLGEAGNESEFQTIRKFSGRLLWAMLASGILFFAAAQIHDLEFLHAYISQPLSVLAIILTVLSIPLMFFLMRTRKVWWMRILAAVQITLIVAGWFVVQWPRLIVFEDGSNWNIYDVAAPESTMRVLFWCLVIGACLILPTLMYLFKVFKVDREG